MREIKFRAWDKVNKIMHEDAFDAVRSFTSMMYRPERFVLMQFTGLKDKNGKEIYEGDIITIVDKASEWTEATSREKFSHFIVEWSEVLAGWFPKSLNGYEPDETWWQTWEVEVIGNIYENSELLNN